MIKKLLIPAVSSLWLLSQISMAATPVRLRPGFVTKLNCRGKIIASSLGNSELLELQVYPKNNDCAVFLRPRRLAGETNLFIETNIESYELRLLVSENSSIQFQINLDDLPQGKTK